MPPIGDDPEIRPQWGDYRVGPLVAENAHTQTRTFRAEQISVRRDVLLEQLNPEAAADRERAKT